jgi:hypothetical protein
MARATRATYTGTGTGGTGTAGTPSTEVASVQGVTGGTPQPMVLNADARTGSLSSGTWTLGSTSVVETVSIPDSARGFRLRPSSDVKFAVGEDPVANGAESLTTGNTAYANETEVRLLDAGASRTLRLLTTVAAATVGVGFF